MWLGGCGFLVPGVVFVVCLGVQLLGLVLCDVALLWWFWAGAGGWFWVVGGLNAFGWFAGFG